jgi:DNA-binding transcriptional MerR regulator
VQAGRKNPRRAKTKQASIFVYIRIHLQIRELTTIKFNLIIIVELEVRFKSRVFGKSIFARSRIMFYSIGEVAKKLNLPTSTLRYYDREGLLSNVKRSSGGIRVFSDADVATLKVVECLKATGMQIVDIKQFLDWCAEGDRTLQKRRDMFYERRAVVEKQMEALQKTLDMVQFKCWYYETACEVGGEDALTNMSINEMPEEAKKGKAVLERSLSE